MRKSIAALLLIAMPAIANAETSIPGVWASPAACQALKAVQSGANTFPDGMDSFTYLRDSGMTGWEWGCDFLHKSHNAYGQTVAVSSCSGEGDSWPELYLIERVDNKYRVVAGYEGGKQWTIEFEQQCEGVE